MRKPGGWQRGLRGLGLLVALAAISAGAATQRPAPQSTIPTVRIHGIDVDDWVFQLQGRRGAPLDLAPLASTNFDLAVIDYSATGGGEQEFTPAAIAALKQGPTHPKVVLAYLSIGEAEKVRYYFDPTWLDRRNRPTAAAPSWLGPADPGWPDNYKVRYWDPAWQAVLFGTASDARKSYLDRIIDQGFDGVYLDIIDAFEFWGPGGPHPERPAAAADMVALVDSIADYARNTRGRTDFLVVPQNGPNIIHGVDDPTRRAYFAHIDGIGAEDTFFYGNQAENNAYRPQRDTIADLDAFREAGKFVLSVDYVTARAKVRRFYADARAHGYIAYAGVRALDRPVTTRDFPPD